MSELIAALNQLEKEKGIDKDVIMEAIENSLLAACKRDFGSADNVVVNMDRETGDIYVYAIKEVVDEVYDPALEISLGKAKELKSWRYCKNRNHTKRFWTYCSNACKKRDRTED